MEGRVLHDGKPHVTFCVILSFGFVFGVKINSHVDSVSKI